MINIARRKYASNTNLKFEPADITKVDGVQDYDYIFMADVLEHVEDLNGFFSALNRLTKPGAKIIISVANPLWEPVLMLSEKLGMKMPEGPHWRLSLSQNEAIFKKNGFQITDKGYRLLIPKKMPGSDLINNIFYRYNVMARFGFIAFWILEKN